MMNKIKNPPKGGDDSKWVFKKCRFQKTIIKKGKYKKLPNGDIVITEHEGMIGFKKKKKRTGAGHKPTNHELLLELKNDFKQLRNDFNTVVKLNNLKTK